MSIRVSSRSIVMLLLVAFVSGCSSVSTGYSGQKFSSTRIDDECKSNRSRCLYDGAYEPGERDYAEQEAKRLNLAESDRIRRSLGK